MSAVRTAPSGAQRAPRAVPPRFWGALPRGPLYLGLAIVLTAVLFSYPAISSLITSFTGVDAQGNSTFVGLANYQRLLADPEFYQSFANTIVFAAIFVIGTVVLGLLLALALYSRIPGHGIWRFIILAPSFLPIAFIGVIWQIGLDPSIGWVSSLLTSINPSLNQAWLSNPATVMPLIAAISVIQGAGWPMAIMWTSLQDVPPEIVEASLMDGANGFQRVRSILVPSIRDTIATVTLLQIIFALKVFDMPWVMTRGGPAHSSETLTIFVYNQAFTNQDFGYGCAAAVVSCLAVVVVSLAYLVISRRRSVSL